MAARLHARLALPLALAPMLAACQSGADDSSAQPRTRIRINPGPYKPGGDAVLTSRSSPNSYESSPVTR